MPPASSNDLVIEQLRELLEDRRRELNEGITPRALAHKLEEHTEKSEERHVELDRRIREVEAALRARSAVSDFRMETGRHTLVHPTEQGYARPAPPPSKRPSLGPVIKAAVKSPVFNWLGIVVIVAASHLLTKCGIQPPPPPVPPNAAVSH